MYTKNKEGALVSIRADCLKIKEDADIEKLYQRLEKDGLKAANPKVKMGFTLKPG